MNRASGSPGRAAIAAVAVLAGGAVLVPAVLVAQHLEDTPFLRIDPQRTVLEEGDRWRSPCGECHVAEHAVWLETKHAVGFDSLHRKPMARDILKRLDLRVAKRSEALCMRCHYTVGRDSTAIAGVSCESCHGPARDWLAVHRDWGEGIEHPERESEDHRRRRIAAAEAGGMLRPSGNLYGVAANCFECHSVPMERLVNVGGHGTGTGDFDLLERVDRIRHNFKHRQWTDDAGNRAPSADRARMMFVLGRMLAYEYAVRSVAEATDRAARYFQATQRAAKNAYRGLDEVGRVARIPAVTEVLALGKDLDLTTGNRAALLQAAERMRAVGQAFSAEPPYDALAALDPLMAGEPAQAAMAELEAPAAPRPRAARRDTAPTPAREAVAEPTGSAAPRLPGKVRSMPAWLQKDRQYATTLPNCGKCHGDAEGWYFRDPHSESLVRLEDRSRARAIAELYGIGAAGMLRGDQICMNCHGTIESASPVVVRSSVSCESCHGPSSGYLDPHEDGGNPQLGMRALKDPAVRAATCAGCHHITDERLLAAGHTSGSDYDFVTGNAAIEHFPAPAPSRGRQRRGETAYTKIDAGTLRAAWSRATSGRPVPSVQVASPPAPQPGRSTTARRAPASGPAISPQAVTMGGRGGASSVPPRPASVRVAPPGSASLQVDLPAVTDTDSLTAEELLLVIQQRLEQLNRAIQGGR